MQRVQEQRLNELQDISSRDGVRGAVRYLYGYLKDYLRRDQVFKNTVVGELTPLYGEYDYTPAEIASGTQSVLTVTVADAIPGFLAQVSYDEDLEGLQMSAYCLSGQVKIVLANLTGSAVTLTAGRFRVYVQPKELSS